MVTSDSDGNTTLTRGLHFLKNVKLWNLDVERHRRIILFEWFSNCAFGMPFPNHHPETPTEQRRARHFMEISIWRIPGPDSTPVLVMRQVPLRESGVYPD